MIEQQIIDRILDATNIVDVIAEYVTLNKKGVNYWGVCPFHTDRNPSMCVSPAKQIFKCFVCGEAGNVVTFLQKHESLTYPEAIRLLGKRCHIDVPDKELTAEEQQRMSEKESIHIALLSAGEKFQKNLLADIDAKAYLKARGWTAGVDPTLDLYQVGYACNAWRTLTDGMKQSAFNSDILTAAGLSVKGEKGIYDVFRDRIMFPYFDLRGNIIGFTGRLVHPSDKTAKYCNTGETPVFRKGSVLFGLYQAKQAIGQQDKVYFVEGQFDVLSFVRAGIRNTICGSGTALTDEQIKTVLRFSKNITLIYDTDEAGVKASIKNIKALLSVGANVRAISLPDGEDPDSFARRMSDKELGIYLHNHEVDWVTYLASIYKPDFDDPVKKNDDLSFITSCIALVQDRGLKMAYTTKLSELFKTQCNIIKEKIKEHVQSLPVVADLAKSGFYGIEELVNTLPDTSENCILTDSFSTFKDNYGEAPIVYTTGLSSADQIQEFRRHASYLQFTYSANIAFDERRESDLLITLCALFKAGFTLYVEKNDVNFEFVEFYIRLYAADMEDKTGDVRTIYYGRCADIISSTSDAAQSVMEKEWYSILKLNSKSYRELLKPYREKRKSKHAMLQKRNFDDTLICDDPDIVPDYVEENEEYGTNYKRHGFYPLLNREKEPVSYMFKNPSGTGHTPVADFYMIPLLHIYDTDSEYNKRVIKINRRYYKKPIFIEIKSKALASMQSFEEVLLNEEALNFENGEVRHFKKIRQAMSYKYITCEELRTYGQQQENFYAFSNAIFHEVDGEYRIDMTSDLGVVTHNSVNYYAPAFSSIYAGLRKDNDKFEQIRYFVYKDILKEKQCSFQRWASLMDQVYTINDNGKWAIIYAAMCAFRSDIHAIDRLFTALFFMGPTMSGKTQIAVSIRSLYIDPDLPCFNLNTGTDAAFFTLMGGFRDVPQVLEEYNNNDISKDKFQGLKSVTYDGDGKQKRKGTGSKDIETSKVYSPVIICGQETPQRDDNALMNRVVICEVPKKKETFSAEEAAIFQELKGHEKTGLSNILFDVLKLRPLVRKHFKTYMRKANKALTESVLVGTNGSGDMTRIINTISLFLAMCKLLEEQAPHLKLPFTYDEFYSLATKKVTSQVEMISHTDKLAGFFKAMDMMINTKAIVEGRDFSISQRGKLTITLEGKEKKEVSLPAGTKVLFLRMKNVHPRYEASSFNSEKATQSTIEANLRSNPAYIGTVSGWRFKWDIVKEVPKGDVKAGEVSNEMVRIIERQEQVSNCTAMNYDIFKQYFDIDLERNSTDTGTDPADEEAKAQTLPF